MGMQRLVFIPSRKFHTVTHFMSWRMWCDKFLSAQLLVRITMKENEIFAEVYFLYIHHLRV